MRSHSAARAAFTLVELLVVISIVAILIATLIPAISRAKREARYVLCQSNIRQAGLALMLYETDARSFPTGIGVYFGPDDPILPYVSGNKAVWYCPDRESYTLSRFGTADWPSIGYFYWGPKFPQGFRQQYGVFPDDINWTVPYFPLIQDQMMQGTIRVPGFGFFVDPETGECNDYYNRFAHMDANLLLDRSNAMRHDGSVSAQKYAYARRVGYGPTDIYNWNTPGVISNQGNWAIHLVAPEPFALRISGPETYVASQFTIK